MNPPGKEIPADDVSSGCGPQPDACGLSCIHVVAGAVFDEAGRVLVAERPAGKHMAGHWEFPGGKLTEGEERFAGLQRELKEELGIDVAAAQPLISYDHEYPGRRVTLDLWCVTDYSGSPASCEGQKLKWVSLPDLDKAELLEADKPMIQALREACRQ